MGQYSRAVVVPGEAPESDDEHHHRDKLYAVASDEHVIVANKEVSRSKPHQDGPDFESLLHKKLYETSINLALMSKQLIKRHHTALAKDLNGLVTHGTNFRGMNEDTCYKMKGVAKDLYKIDDQLDAILKLNTLPEAIEVTDFPAINKWSKGGRKNT